MGIACADTAATHSIADETLYHTFKKKKEIFTFSSLMKTLDDDNKLKREIQTTTMKIHIGGHTLPLNLVTITEEK